MVINWYKKYKEQKLKEKIKKLEWALSVLKPQHSTINGISCYYSDADYYQVGNYIIKKSKDCLYLGGKINEEVDYIKIIDIIYKEAVTKLRNEKYNKNFIKIIKEDKANEK